jgi:hypothetical protein
MSECIHCGGAHSSFACDEKCGFAGPSDEDVKRSAKRRAAMDERDARIAELEAALADCKTLSEQSDVMRNNIDLREQLRLAQSMYYDAGFKACAALSPPPRWTTTPPGPEHEGRSFWVRYAFDATPVIVFYSGGAWHGVVAWAGPIQEPVE